MAGELPIYANTGAGNLPNHWTIRRFEDFVFSQEGPGIRNWQYVNEDDGIPFVNIRCLVNGRLDRASMNKVSKEEAFGKYAHFLLDVDDYVVSSSGTLGRLATVQASDLPCMLNTSVIRMRPKSAELDRGYLKYFILSGYYQRQITSFATGSAQLNYGPMHLRQMFIVVPPLKVQQAIACILGALDDKIELNRRMNETLEEMAQAIFKSWFVDFDPVRAKVEARESGAKSRPTGTAGQQPAGLPKPLADLFRDSFEDSALGEIPKGWGIGVVGDVATQTIGGQWGFDSQEDGLFPAVCLRGCDMEDIRCNGYAPAAPVRFVKSNAIKTRLPSESDVLIAASGAGPCGRPLWFSPLIRDMYAVPVIYSNFVKRFTTPSPAHAVYLDRVLIGKFQDHTIHDFINGTSVPNLDATGLLASCSLVIPPADVLEAFFSFCSSIYDKLYSRENLLLANLRDALLPKLLSGEVRITDAERIVGRGV